MATIKDIAKAAGVSVTTVSRALNGYSDVNEKTREKIKKAAEELNYSPNAVARSLVMKKTKTLGLLISEISREGSKDNFTFEVLCGMNDRAGELDYDLVVFSTTSSKQKDKTYAQLCRERRVDGVFIQGIKSDDPYLTEVLNSDIPCVLLDIPIESDTVGYVTTDNVLGAQKAVEHLLSLNHQNIAMINGHDQAFVSKERLAGYQKALKKAGIPFQNELVVNGRFHEEEAKMQALDLLKKHPNITAIFCASDLMALGAIKAAKLLGLNTPEDLSIVGYDDILLASYSSPPLTTVRQNKYQIGYEAANLLVDLLEKEAPSHKKVLNTELIVRESTKKNHH